MKKFDKLYLCIILIIIILHIKCNDNKIITIVNQPKYSQYIEIEKIKKQSLNSNVKKSNLSDRISDIEIDKNGNIYILDINAANIKVFDSTFCFRYIIGKRGTGPGEFTDGIRKMHFINDSILIIADEALKRMNILNKNGNYIADFRYPSQVIDDILYKNGYYYASSFEMKQNHSPIKIMDENFNITKTFGKVIPTRARLFEDLKKLRNPSIYERFLSNGTFTKIALTNKYIFYAQRNPYKIFKFDYYGNLLKSFYTEFEFSSELNINFFENGDESRIKFGPQSMFNGMHLINDSLLFVLVVKPGKTPEDTSKFKSFIDFYDLEGNNVHRSSITLDGQYPYDLVKTFYRNETGCLYVLIRSRNAFPVINVFKIRTK